MSAQSVRLTNNEYSTNSMAEIRFNKMPKTCSRIKTVALTYSIGNIESAEKDLWMTIHDHIEYQLHYMLSQRTVATEAGQSISKF